MTSVCFEAGGLDRQVPVAVRQCLEAEHRRRPFVASDAREAAQRARRELAALSVVAVTFRGGLQLRGAEVDHVWLAVGAGDDPWVLDVAFPLFAADFVALLPRYVAGDIERDTLDTASRHAPLDQRVLGRPPPLVRYCGEPVWWVRHEAG
jgi:hypothetical protein